MDLDEVVYHIACGLDVHFAFVAACLVSTGPKGKVKVEEREFPTNQRGLHELRSWLEAGKGTPSVLDQFAESAGKNWIICAPGISGEHHQDGLHDGC